MIDVCFGSIFSCLTYSNLLRFPFFMKLAHRHLFAVLFSFQRTIALSDLISLSRHFSFVKQIFLFFLCFFRAVYRLTDGGYYPIILFLFCQPGFFRFYRCFHFLLTQKSLSPNTEGSAGPCEVIGARVRTWVRIFKSCILCRILTAPVGRVWRLTHFCSVALLLEKWFACHHSFPYFFILVFPTAFYDRSRMTGKYLMPLCKNRFFRFCSHLPLSSANAATVPVFGDGLHFARFPFM